MSALKLAFGCLILITSLFFINSTIFAATSIEFPGGTPVNATDYGPLQHTGYGLENMECDFIGKMSGINPCGKQITRVVNTTTGASSLMLFDRVPGGGAIGGLTTTIAVLYNPPTSSVEYLANLGENIGLSIKPAYAQVGGSGQGIIAPVLSLWQALRNIALLAFTVIFLVVGVMIMLRQKISPQAVITIQAALPSLVIGLILVVFSYFIAALIVDTAFIGVRLVAQIFAQANTGNIFGDQKGLMNLAENGSVLNMFGSIAIQFPQNVGDITGGAYRTVFGSWSGLGMGALITGIIGAIIATIVTGGLALPAILLGAGAGAAGVTVAPMLVGLIVPLILLIALFIQMFKLLFALIGTYIQLLIATISGPLVILVASIPGRGGGIGNWVKSLLANALVFPAVFAGFLFAGMILATPTSSWQASPPLFGGLPIELLRVLIAYGILLALPAIPDAVRTALGVKGQPGIAQAALGGFMGGVAVAQGGYNKWVEPQRQLQRTFGEAQARNTVDPTAPVPVRPPRRFPWVF